MKANVFEVKARLSEFLARIEQGESVIICRRNRPIAELRPLTRARVEPRPIGGAKGLLVVPDAFFEPLPSEVVAGFDEGRAYDGASPLISFAREIPATGAPLSRPRPSRTAKRKTSKTRRRR